MNSLRENLGQRGIVAYVNQNDPLARYCVLQSRKVSGYLLLLFALLLGGCVTSSQVYSFRVQRIDSAYMDAKGNIYVCVEGTLGGDDDDSSKTIILPVADAAAQLTSGFLHNPVAVFGHFQDSEIQGFQLSRKWFRQGCISAHDKAELRPVRVVVDLVPPDHARLLRRLHVPQHEYRQAERDATAAYLGNMTAGETGDALYQVRDPNGKILPALVYVTESPRFNGTNKIGFSLVWTEEHVSPVKTVLTPVALVAAVTVMSSVALGEKVHGSRRTTVPSSSTPYSDDEKRKLARDAAALNKCRGEVSDLPNEPPSWNHPTERAFLVRCGKAEMKVYCRYTHPRSSECFFRWAD